MDLSVIHKLLEAVGFDSSVNLENFALDKHARRYRSLESI